MDWGSFGEITIEGRVRKLYAFIYILSYSRAIYVEFVVSQKLKTLMNCHKNAFSVLGIPDEIVYDNMKQVVTRNIRLPSGERQVSFNPEFFNFASHYGFKLKACHPYWPRSKGKVEATVKYLRNNFMNNEKFGKTFYDLTELNDKAVVWVNEIANQRSHRTTGQQPILLWGKEKEHLRFPDDIPVFDSDPLVIRRSNKDGYVQHKNNFYEVPREFSQKKLFIRQVISQSIDKVEIYKSDSLIITYIVSTDRGKIVPLKDGVLNPVLVLSAEKAQLPRPKRKIATRELLNIEIPKRDLSYYDRIISSEGGK